MQPRTRETLGSSSAHMWTCNDVSKKPPQVAGPFHPAVHAASLLPTGCRVSLIMFILRIKPSWAGALKHVLCRSNQTYVYTTKYLTGIWHDPRGVHASDCRVDTRASRLEDLYTAEGTFTTPNQGEEGKATDKLSNGRRRDDLLDPRSVALSSY